MKSEDALTKLLDLLRAFIDGGSPRPHLPPGHLAAARQGRALRHRQAPALFRSFEEKSSLARLLSDFISLDRVKVLIGAEANFPNVEDCSLVLSHYGYSNQVLGTLGIIGPKRIPYEKIIPLVDRMAKRVSLAITVFGREVSL